MLFISISVAGCNSSDRLKVTTTGYQEIPMVYVEKGYFPMAFSDGITYESPSYNVWLDSFYLDKYEVTNGFYKMCVADGVCNPPEHSYSAQRDFYYGNPDFENYPVIFIDWNDAENFCKWRGARLPTEAEWMKAARGNNLRLYPWGNEFSCKYANLGTDKECVRALTEVGSYPEGVSPYGAYDMAGNVEEWVYDCYREDQDPSYLENAINPIAEEAENCHRVVKGGAFFLTGAQARITARLGYFTEDKLNILGFRCAISP